MITRLTDSLLSALLAPPCAVCERILDRPLNGAVCDDCWDSIVCSAHSFHTPGISSAAAIGEYDGVLREIIHAFKYQGRRSTAPRLASLMAAQGAAVLNGADAVVPVPLHPRRERERGFNQADDLARGLGVPVARMLRRVKNTLSQVDLPAAERQINMKDAFEVAAGLPPSLTIVLVDDVTTTGATLAACARVLKAAGAAEVRALTAARVGTLTAPRKNSP